MNGDLLKQAAQRPANENSLMRQGLQGIMGELPRPDALSDLTGAKTYQTEKLDRYSERIALHENLRIQLQKKKSPIRYRSYEGPRVAEKLQRKNDRGLAIPDKQGSRHSVYRSPPAGPSLQGAIPHFPAESLIISQRLLHNKTLQIGQDLRRLEETGWLIPGDWELLS